MLAFRHPFFLAACLGLALALPARAQRVYWDPGSGTLGLGQTSTLDLVFEDCAPEGDVDLPDVDGLHFGTPGSENRVSIINGDIQRRVVLHYPVEPQRRGTIEIPAFDVQTSIGPVAVGEARYDVGEPSVGQTGIAVGDIVQARLEPARTTVYVGEVLELEYVIIGSGRYNVRIAGDPQWSPAGWVAEEFGQGERVDRMVNGERRPAYRFRTRIMATKPGQLTLPAVQQRVAIQTGERSGFFFSQPRIEEFTISSDQPVITVQPLPQPAPADFLGAVGDFSLESKIVPEKARVGEPITWTLTLRGAGNWPANLRVPEREVSTDFQIVQPKSQQQMDNGRLFQGSLTEDAVLVPTRAGQYQLGPVSFSWFDPAAGAYRHQAIAATTVTIEPPPAAAPKAPPPAAGNQPATSDQATPAAPAPPALPDDLAPTPPVLRRPLALGRPGLAPFDLEPAWWLLVAFVPAILTWLGLAWRQAWRSNAARLRRQARREILRTLDAAQKASARPDRSVLEIWRRQTARLWQVPQATPTAGDLENAINAAGASAAAAAWTRLWQEAEDTLFSAGRELPEDWLRRALGAIRVARVGGAKESLPMRRRHWLPRPGTALVLLLALGLGASRLEATDPAAAYQEGRFDQAEAGWRQAVIDDPRDWAAHNNLALALAQTGNWPEAAAHWTAALLLHPRDPDIAANLRLALSHLDGIDPTVRRLVSENWIDRAATLLSPAAWEVTLLVGAALFALGPVLGVLGLYRGSHQSRWRRSAWAAIAAGGAVSVIAWLAHGQYGLLARSTAALVVEPSELHSIPTDLAKEQQKAPLSPGTVVVVGDSFLGWQLVETGNSVEGWVRAPVIAPFFQAPAGPTSTAAKSTRTAAASTQPGANEP